MQPHYLLKIVEYENILQQSSKERISYVFGVGVIQTVYIKKKPK